jgi:cytochrome c oxidase subunit 2
VKKDEFESWAAHQKDPAMGSPAALAAQAAADSAAKKKPAAVAKAGVVPSPEPAAAPSGFVFPVANLKPHNIPNTPYPAGLTFQDNLIAQGDAKRGHDLVTNPANLGKAPCLTCHVINGEKGYVNDDLAKGPNLTHVGTRHTFAGGLFPADAAHLVRWVKNAPHMKPGALMNTFGQGEYNPVMKSRVTAGMSDAEIADIVAYLLSLK